MSKNSKLQTEDCWKALLKLREQKLAIVLRQLCVIREAFPSLKFEEGLLLFGKVSAAFARRLKRSR